MRRHGHGGKMLTVVTLALAVACGPCAADDAPVSRDAAAAAAREAVGGRVLGVRRDGERYRVRLLLEGGRVRTVAVDARTGRVVE